MYDALNDQWRAFYDDIVMDFMLTVPQLALKYIFDAKSIKCADLRTQDCARTLLERVIKRTYKRLLD